MGLVIIINMHDINYWKEKLPEFMQQLDEMLEWPLPFVINPRFEPMKQEALEEAKNPDTARQAVKKALYSVIDSSQDPLSSLLSQCVIRIQEFLPDLSIDSNEVLDIIHEMAHRKSLGVHMRKKNIYEDTSPACMWYWELDQYPQPRSVKEERGNIGKMIKFLRKMIDEITKESPNIESIVTFHHEFNKIYKKYSLLKENKISCLIEHPVPIEPPVERPPPPPQALKLTKKVRRPSNLA